MNFIIVCGGNMETNENIYNDITEDYKYILNEISAGTGLPIERIIIESLPCGEGWIFDTATGNWFGYVSEYLEEGR